MGLENRWGNLHSKLVCFSCLAIYINWQVHTHVIPVNRGLIIFLDVMCVVVFFLVYKTFYQQVCFRSTTGIIDWLAGPSVKSGVYPAWLYWMEILCVGAAGSVLIRVTSIVLAHWWFCSRVCGYNTSMLFAVKYAGFAWHTLEVSTWNDVELAHIVCSHSGFSTSACAFSQVS
jgi:hypothetical protein